ncbi:MAG TPA: pyridoxamine 5'-phosphate oxidase family protein [Caulobacteraceae bacterium]|nr:pyridoxamine 5'-phosphate oxidase family protein [Caulobacteraceae bacterium]
MGQFYPCLDNRLIAFIRAQKVFFVATAPLAPDGHVNVSPKGYDSLAILDERTIAYADLGGSGIETHAHVRENGRITLMFCAFEGPANIVRVYGQGEVVSFDDPGFEAAMAAFPDVGRARGVITVHIELVADSCGWGVPFFEFKGEREQLRRWVEAKPFGEWAEHRRKANAASIDRLPGLNAVRGREG